MGTEGKTPRYETFQSEEVSSNKGAVNKDFTLEEAIDIIGVGWEQIRIAIIIGIGWMSDTAELMTISILGAVLMCDWKLSYTQIAFITTITFLGYLIGSPIFGVLSDRYGRKTSLILGAIWTAFYSILSSFAPVFCWLLILRGLTGFGLGVATQGLAYLSELVPSNNRGKFIYAVAALSMTGGPLVVMLAMLFMQYGWRIWIVSVATPFIMYIFLMGFVPSSPKQELAYGHIDSARKILEKLAVSNNKKLPEGRLVEREIKAQGNFTDLFKPEHRITSVLLAIIWTLVVGSYYSTVLLTTELVKRESACIEGVSKSEGCPCPLTTQDYLQILGSACVEFPVLFLTVAFVDRVGRKVIWYIAIILYGSCTVLLFVCMPRIPMLVVLYFGRSGNAIAHQLVFLYTSEVYPTEFRGLALGMGTSFGRIGALLAPFIAQVLLSWSLQASLIVLCLQAVTTFVLVYCLPKDPGGKHID